uniref:Uncharacterized protein n=1 Tax=Romanomermis culicivorax TaxID=13658 RepID=A0A915L9W2_ROMCU
MKQKCKEVKDDDQKFSVEKAVNQLPNIAGILMISALCLHKIYDTQMLPHQAFEDVSFFLLQATDFE